MINSVNGHILFRLVVEGLKERPQAICKPDAVGEEIGTYSCLRFRDLHDAIVTASSHYSGEAVPEFYSVVLNEAVSIVNRRREEYRKKLNFIEKLNFNGMVKENEARNQFIASQEYPKYPDEDPATIQNMIFEREANVRFLKNYYQKMFFPEHLEDHAADLGGLTSIFYERAEQMGIPMRTLV